MKFFFNCKSLFNEAFDDVYFKQYPWGAQFTIPGIHFINQNLTIISEDPKGDLPNLIDWEKNEKSRKILVNQIIDLEIPLNNNSTASFSIREAQKISFPLLEFGQIQQYSYGSSQNISTIRGIISSLIDISDVPDAQRSQFETFIGGLLHLNNANIWTIELDEGNIISAVIEITNSDYRNLRSLEYIAVKKNFRGQGHATSLIQAILSQYKKDRFVMLHENNDVFGIFSERFNFHQIMKFDVFSSE